MSDFYFLATKVAAYYVKCLYVFIIALDFYLIKLLKKKHFNNEIKAIKEMGHRHNPELFFL